METSGVFVIKRLIFGLVGLLPLLGLAALVSAPAAPGSSGGSSATVQQLLDSPHVDLPFDARLASVSCPVERGPVKEGSDADRAKVDNTAVTKTVNYLRNIGKPSVYPTNARVTQAELHKYRVVAHLRQFKEESDGDYHLVLKDSSGRSMIAEIPYGGCVPAASRWKTAIAKTRSAFNHHYSVSTSWHYVNRKVVLQGIGFMDVLHGQTGVAPNGVELHPVTHVYFP